MNMTKEYGMRTCGVCQKLKHTTNTDMGYVCEPCMKEHFYDTWFDLKAIRNTVWYKIGKALRLVK